MRRLSGFVPPSRHPVPDRVIERVRAMFEGRDRAECWPWPLSTGSHGYGQIGWGTLPGRSATTTAHRVAWIAAHGPIPVGMTVDHECKNPLCFNPFAGHGRLKTNPENAADNRQAQRGKGRRSYKESSR